MGTIKLQVPRSCGYRGTLSLSKYVGGSNDEKAIAYFLMCNLLYTILMNPVNTMKPIPTIKRYSTKGLSGTKFVYATISTARAAIQTSARRIRMLFFMSFIYWICKCSFLKCQIEIISFIIKEIRKVSF